MLEKNQTQIHKNDIKTEIKSEKEVSFGFKTEINCELCNVDMIGYIIELNIIENPTTSLHINKLHIMTMKLNVDNIIIAYFLLQNLSINITTIELIHKNKHETTNSVTANIKYDEMTKSYPSFTISVKE